MDCSNVYNLIKEIDRLCDSYQVFNCFGCPLRFSNSECLRTFPIDIDFVEKVQKWSNNNSKN